MNAVECWSTDWTIETQPRDENAPARALHVVRYRRKASSRARVRPVFELELEDGRIVERRAAGDISGPPRWVLS